MDAYEIALRRIAEARALAARTGIDMPETAPQLAKSIAEPVDDKTSWGKSSWAGLFISYPLATFLLGLMSATGLTLVYSLNIWLPELMLRAGFDARGSLSFLMVLNGGAAGGPASYPLFPPFRPARSIACSRVSQVSTQNIIGTPESIWASWIPREVSEAT